MKHLKLFNLLFPCLILIFCLGIAIIFTEALFFYQQKKFYFQKSIYNKPAKQNLNRIEDMNLQSPEYLKSVLIPLEKDSFIQIEPDLYLYEVPASYICDKDIQKKISFRFSCLKKDLNIPIKIKFSVWYKNGRREDTCILANLDNSACTQDKSNNTYGISSARSFDAAGIQKIQCFFYTARINDIEKPLLLIQEVFSKPEWNSANRLYRQPINFKKGHRYRILCIGESTTYGVSIDAGSTWPAILQMIFNTTFPGEVEVVNLGRQGQFIDEFKINLNFSTFIHRDYFSREDKDYQAILSDYQSHAADFGWKDLNADMLIVAPAWNDVTNIFLREITKVESGSLEYLSRIRNFIETNSFFNKLALSYYLSKYCFISAENFIIKNNLVKLNLDEEIRQIIEKKYKTDLLFFIEALKKTMPQAKIYLLSLPGIFSDRDYSSGELEMMSKNLALKFSVKQLKFYSLFQKFTEEIVVRCMEDLARQEEINYLDFASLSGKERYSGSLLCNLYIDPYHFTAVGNNAISEFIFNKIDFKKQILKE